ncbi:hypothetical protein ACLOJK_035640 [Asimina triloba]
MSGFGQTNGFYKCFFLGVSPVATYTQLAPRQRFFSRAIFPVSKKAENLPKKP